MHFGYVLGVVCNTALICFFCHDGALKDCSTCTAKPWYARTLSWSHHKSEEFRRDFVISGLKALSLLVISDFPLQNCMFRCKTLAFGFCTAGPFLKTRATTGTSRCRNVDANADPPTLYSVMRWASQREQMQQTKLEAQTNSPEVLSARNSIFGHSFNLPQTGLSTMETKVA